MQISLCRKHLAILGLRPWLQAFGFCFSIELSRVEAADQFVFHLLATKVFPLGSRVY
jgi:hypothetical protein